MSVFVGADIQGACGSEHFSTGGAVPPAEGAAAE